MGNHRFRPSMVRRFLLFMAGAAIGAALVSREFGEDVTVWLDRVPATSSGWQCIGWVFAGPPLYLAALAWMDRADLAHNQRRLRAAVYGIWLGLGAFVVPGLADGSYDIFGPGIEVANPLAFGWICGTVGNLAAILFASALGVVRRTATPAGSDPPSQLTDRFIEVAWTLLLGGSLLFAAYGAELGFVY